MIPTTLIADIHGHASKLHQLLTKLNFEQKNGAYKHPDNEKVIFVGDYIDRGPEIKDTLHIVRSMVDAGSAIALMGNHEYNALCFHFQESEGGHLRKHLIKNIIQHYETLKQFQNREKEYEEYLDWFKTLPLFYETDEFRVVHACWDQKNINYLRKELVNDCLNDELIYRSVIKDSPLYKAIDQTLKGKEMRLPNGKTFDDKDGNIRHNIRIRWWENPAKSTVKSISVIHEDYLPDISLEKPFDPYYDESQKPVFFGHYWLRGKPFLFKANVCCLDFSVAKGGPLVGYRMTEPGLLSEENFVFV